MNSGPTYVIETDQPKRLTSAQDHFLQLHHHLISPWQYAAKARIALDQLLLRRAFESGKASR